MNSSHKKTTENLIFDIYNDIKKSKVLNPGLLTGKMGRVLFCLNLYKLSGDEEPLVCANELLEDIFIDLENADSYLYADISFACGLSGFSFLMTILQAEPLLDLDVVEELNRIDEILFNSCLKKIYANENDFLLGSIGIIYCLSSRARRPSVDKYLEKLIEALVEVSVNDKYGVRFKNYLFKNDDTINNLGLSHGLSGIVLVLIEVYKKNIKQAEVKILIAGLLDYLLHNKQSIGISGGKKAFFPLIVREDGVRPDAENIKFDDNYKFPRLAWCYGDLNLALAFYKAGLLFERTDWISVADEIGLNSVKRIDFEDTAVTDAHFCHGSAGVAQCYKTLLNLTQNQVYEDAYLYWIDKTMDFLKKKGIFSSYSSNGILDSLDGIGLVLISYLQPDFNDWEKAVLLY